MGELQLPMGPGAPMADWTNSNGAAALKTKIETFWRERGYEVQVMLVDGPFSAALRATRVDVRSELINGLPRAALKRSGAAMAD